MSLFKERTANAKKVISLQNEINSLKTKLKSSQKSSEDLKIKETLAKTQALVEDLQNQLSALKADLKKARSENRRLKKKVEDKDALH